jgi:carbon storage regulator
MLVLSRRENESIVIDGCIEVTILDIRSKRVRVGIAAPEDITVHRKEVQEMIEKSKKNV